jgi:adenine-specific DNA methylase
MEQWRDIFSPRQLISHYEYLQSFEHFKSEIRDNHSEKEAEAILTILSLVSSKMVDRNSRLTPWDTSKGYPSQIFKGNNLAFRRVFIDNNLTVSGMGYQAQMEKIIESYEEIESYMPEDGDPAWLTSADAASLPQESNSVEAVVIDPPYYSSVQYSELSDVFYVWLKQYLDDVHPDLYASELTNKEDEAVANPSRFKDVADSSSKSDLAKRDYEEKMSDIFSELYRTIEPGGVMTVMFTHKETDAWDTLTMSLIRAGFTITSTHPITSEMPQRAEMRKSASADSTLLLTGRKPKQERGEQQPTLWSEVESSTRKRAKESARDLLESGLSLTKTDVIIGAFGPTLQVFADNYPVVDDEGEEVRPRRALREAREAVTQVLVETYLQGEQLDALDDLTTWYTLSWLIYESQIFPYDEGRQLGLGVGLDIDDKKRDTKIWRKRSGDIQLQYHDDRVQDIDKDPSQRSSRLPVNPDSISFSYDIDKVHAAMHVYQKRGESETWNWLKERGFDSDTRFKASLSALLQVLPHETEDWQLARDLAAGETGDLLALDLDSDIFRDDDRVDEYQGGLDEF